MGSDALLPGDVRPQISSSHSAIGGPLDHGPPLRINVDTVVQPVGNQLLAGRLPVVQLSNAPHESRLLTAANDGDCLRESSNVTVLGVFHKHRGYTNGFVSVNRQACVTENKKVCNVVDLEAVRNGAVPHRARNLAPAAKKPERRAKPGPDGLTLGERLHRAMAYRSGILDREYEPVDLLREANELVGATEDQPVISQQMISEILRGRTSRSSFTPYLAKACGVSSIWLAIGKGSMIEKPSAKK
jgi:hypothetical protein